MLPKLRTPAEMAGAEPNEAETAEPAAEDVTPAAVQPADPARAKRVRKPIIIAVAAVLLLSGAVLLGIGNYKARTSGTLGNTALVDTATTAEVVGQITAAIKTVYSYDFKTMEKNEADAKGVITGEFAGEFDRVFGPVKQLAPKEQAVLTTAVPAAGIMQLDGDHARLLMMVDQRGTRAGGQPLPPTSARLVVEALRVDGHWKIAKVTPE